MARVGESPNDWIGYAWVGRITKDSTPDGRFDAGWAGLDRRKDACEEYRRRASDDAHFIAEVLNSLPALLAAVRRVGEMEEALRLCLPIVEADLAEAIEHCDADWEGMSRTAVDAARAAVGEVGR